jgi:hypothetical protein
MDHQLGHWVAIGLPIIIGVVTAIVLALSSEQEKSKGKR